MKVFKVVNPDDPTQFVNIQKQAPCILDSGCVKTDACDEVCEATAEDIEKYGTGQYRIGAGIVTGSLDLDRCRAVSRAAADTYRIVTALGGAEHLKKVAQDRMSDIMDICETVTGVMDGRPDKP